MTFHEVRLPVRLAFGSTGGVERRTEITTLASGFEQRSTPWAHGRRRYLIGAGVRAITDLSAITEFFEARRGRLHGFRFKDVADYRSGSVVTPLDQPLGTGDGVRTSFQLVKTYGDYHRPIRKPATGTTCVAVNGAETTAFTVDTTTGLVTLATPPTAGAVLTAGFEFDVPVRFDTDRIDTTLESFEAGRLVAAPLIEVRV